MPVMNLGALKTKPLQHIAFLTGVPSTGTKARIIEQLHGSLREARLPQGGCRILSVDMGIRNLAYCVIDVPKEQLTAISKLQVQSWKRLDLLSKMKSDAAISQLDAPPEDNKKPTTAANAILKNSFTPSVMSKVAFQVAQDFLKHKPDVLLIERQRFRSGGGSAIQEWTVRVNTLESMLWACFETLKNSRDKTSSAKSPTLYEVAPKRVANFWTAAPEAHLPAPDLLAEGYSPPEMVRVKAAGNGKKEKIGVLRSWLDGNGSVSLDFSPETQVTAAAFATGLTRRKSRKGEEDGENAQILSHETKLDDLADCVLQGAAWVRWEQNRRAILEAVSDQTTLD